VISRHVSFKTVSIFFVYADLPHTGPTKPLVQKQGVKTVTLNARSSSLQRDPIRLRNNPFLVFIFIFIFSKCTLLNLYVDKTIYDNELLYKEKPRSLNTYTFILVEPNRINCLYIYIYIYHIFINCARNRVLELCVNNIFV